MGGPYAIQPSGLLSNRKVQEVSGSWTAIVHSHVLSQKRDHMTGSEGGLSVNVTGRGERTHPPSGPLLDKLRRLRDETAVFPSYRILAYRYI